MSDEVLTETRDRVLLITLNRPDAMNALNTALVDKLADAFDHLDATPGLTAAVVTGSGRGFCSGMDLKAFATEGIPSGLDRLIRNGAKKPLVAAIEGFALAGGLELALLCDLLVASKSAKLGIPEVKVGLFAAGGGLLRLPTRLPYGVAMEMALTGEAITAEAAHRYGLLNRVVAPGRALEAALELAERVARGAPLAVTASKQILQAAGRLDETELWRYQAGFMDVFSSTDAKEGPKAFAEKRPPVWSGA